MSDPKDRIILHMNKDHQLALLDYVVVYNDERPEDVLELSVRIKDVSVEDITIAYTKQNGTSNKFTLGWDKASEDENVPVLSLLDLRAKLVSMAKYAAAKQGFSHRRVDKVILPSLPIQFFMYAFAGAIFVTCYDKTLIRRSVERLDGLTKVLASSPKALTSAYNIFEDHAKSIAIATYGIHIVEILVKTLPVVRKFRMLIASQLAWVFMNFIEGFLVFSRLASATEEQSH